MPIESIFVTSSYVNVPPIPMFPVTDKSPVTFALSVVDVITPETVKPSGKLGAPFAFWLVIVFALILDSVYYF